jgi:dTDP-glucose 4,6-dehydratase
MMLLVTGGLGFIGSNYIIRKLRDQPELEIINVDNLGMGSNPSNLDAIQVNLRYLYVQGDISIPGVVEALMKDNEIDSVINFAAETHVDRSIRSPRPFLESNYLGTFNLLEAERMAGYRIRHLQVSTDEVYGDILEGSFTEEDELSPSNPYSATKAGADLLCEAYHRTYGMDILVTRCTNNFGPRQHPEKLIPKTIIRALGNQRIPVYGTGENIRDWLYVIDHCQALGRVMNQGESGEIYNISSGNEISVIDIVTEILKRLEKPLDLINHVEDRPGHDIRYSLDSSKVREDLGWKPEYSFKEALKETIEWYMENAEWWKPQATDENLSIKPWEE